MRETGHCGGYRDTLPRLEVQGGLGVLEVKPHRRFNRSCKPIQGNIRNQEVSQQAIVEVATGIRPADEFIRYPRQQPNRGVVQRIGEGLRLTLMQMGEAPKLWNHSLAKRKYSDSSAVGPLSSATCGR